MRARRLPPHWRRTSTLRQPAAFTIVELLFVLILLAIFVVVAFRVSKTLFQLLFTSGEVSRQTALLDDVAESLRTDTWGASTLASTPATLTLITRDGPIVYTLTPGTLTRAAGSVTKTWRLPTAGCSFATEPPHADLLTPAGSLSFSSEPLRQTLRGAK